MKTTTSMMKISVLLGTLGLLSLNAQTHNWNGNLTGSGFWADTANWNPDDYAPNGAGQIVDLRATYTGTTAILINGYNPTVGTLYIGSTNNNLVVLRDKGATEGVNDSILTFDNNGLGALLKSEHNGSNVVLGPGSTGGTNPWLRSPLEVALKDSLTIERGGTGSGSLNMHTKIYAADAGHYTVTISSSSTGGVVSFLAGANATADNYSSISDGTAGGKISVKQASSATQLYLYGENTYTGGTEITNGGHVRITKDSGLGDSSGVLKFTGSGGTLRVDHDGVAFNSDRNIVLDGDGFIDFTYGGEALRSINGTISGEGALTIKSPSGATANTVTLRGVNTYKGGTILQAVRLEVASNSQLGDPNGGLTLNSSSLVIGVNGQAGETINRQLTLINQGTVALRGNSAWLWNGKITGTGKLAKTFAADMIITNGANDYSGGTEVQDGYVLFNNTSGSGAGSGDVTVRAGKGTGGSGSISGNIIMQGAGNLKVGYGSVAGFEMGGSLTLAGALAINYGDVVGTLDISGALNLNSNSITFDLTGYTGGDIDLISFGSLTGGDASSFSFTGLDTSIYSLNLDLGAGVLSLQAIPEPSTYALIMVVGVLALAAFRRHRNR